MSVALVFENLVGAVRHLARRIGNGREHRTDHRASALRHAGDHAANQANARNADLSIERHRWCRKWLQESECARQPATQIAARHDRINEAGLKQKLAALEADGEFVADGAGGDARATEADERVRFSNVEVAEGAERGDGAAGGWVGQHANEGSAAQLEARDGGERLWQLH